MHIDISQDIQFPDVPVEYSDSVLPPSPPFEQNVGRGKEPKLQPGVKYFSDVVPQNIQWYWYPFYRRGAVNIDTATQGTGKSFKSCKVAAESSLGRRGQLPFQNLQYDWNPFFANSPEVTLLLNAEDDPDTEMVYRLMKCGADLSHIAYVETAAMNINFYNPLIEVWISESKCTAVWFDPFQQFFTGHDPYGNPLNMNDSASVRPVMTHLKQLARKYNVAIILICHPNKNSVHNSLHSTMGSNDITAAARSAVYTGIDPDNPENRIMALTKANAIPDSHKKSLIYRFDMDNGGIVFCGESELSADDVNTKRPKRVSEEDKSMSAKNVAKDWLNNKMDECGKMEVTEIIRMAERTDIKRSTLFEALKASPHIHSTGKANRYKRSYWYIDGHEPTEEELKIPRPPVQQELKP